MERSTDAAWWWAAGLFALGTVVLLPGDLLKWPYAARILMAPFGEEAWKLAFVLAFVFGSRSHIRWLWISIAVGAGFATYEHFLDYATEGGPSFFLRLLSHPLYMLGGWTVSRPLRTYSRIVALWLPPAMALHFVNNVMPWFVEPYLRGVAKLLLVFTGCSTLAIWLLCERFFGNKQPPERV